MLGGDLAPPSTVLRCVQACFRELLGRKDVIVANVRYYLQDLTGPPPEDALAEEEPAHPNG